MTECDLAQHVELPNAEAQRTATGDMQSEHNPCMTGVAGEGMHAFWGGHAQLSWKGLSKEQDGTLRFEQFPWQNAYSLSSGSLDDYLSFTQAFVACKWVLRARLESSPCLCLTMTCFALR